MSDKITLSALIQLKKQGRPIAMLTCYDYATATLLQQAHVDGIIVGDSLAQLVLGHANTLSANMDIMIALTAAVRRGAPQTYLVGDMPFLSYQVGPEKAVTNAGRFLVEAGCDAVKLEVDHRHLDLVAALTTAGIPVMAHMGYRPQAAYQIEKIVQTRQAQLAQHLVHDCQKMVEAGASLVLLECVTANVAQVITERLEVPVISCGSGPFCDGQVLVLHDVLGLPGGPGGAAPRFSKTYCQIADQIRTAAAQYIDDIHQRRFPDAEHSYHMPPDQKQIFDGLLADF